MKKAKPLFLILGAAALAVAVLAGAMGIAFQATSANATGYYSRIDNAKVEKITPHGGMNYRYYLVVYREDGSASNLELDTSRILRDGAYILIKTAPLRGVISWEELAYDQLPAPVQNQYP